MEQYTPLIYVGAGVGLVVVILVATRIYEKKRREGWLLAARNLGFEFQEDAAPLMERFGSFKVFQQGHSRRVRYALVGRHGAAEAYLIDYQYTTGGGKHQTRHRQTLCVFRSPKLKLPHCFVRRQKALFDLLGKAFGGQDIDFDDDREFSKSFVLQGVDEEATREVFDWNVRRSFLQLPSHDFQVEVLGGTVLVNPGRSIKPVQAADHLDWGHSILRIFG
ncbi:MAG: hypothetical protein P1V51_05960 [Deltaproteobacteria bacterium]|nr:hypothetical protein [Deltaproteobacteria bacterium]